jgi:hypothetical protein
MARLFRSTSGNGIVSLPRIVWHESLEAAARGTSYGHKPRRYKTRCEWAYRSARK